jgi:hypothetical protein
LTVELKQVYCKQHTANDCRVKAPREAAFSTEQAIDRWSFVRG